MNPVSISSSGPALLGSIIQACFIIRFQWQMQPGDCCSVSFFFDNFLFTLCNNLKPSCPQLPSNHPRLNESRMVALKMNFCPSDHDWRRLGHHLWSKNAAEIQCIGVRAVPDTLQFTGKHPTVKCDRLQNINTVSHFLAPRIFASIPESPVDGLTPCAKLFLNGHPLVSAGQGSSIQI